MVTLQREKRMEPLKITNMNVIEIGEFVFIFVFFVKLVDVFYFHLESTREVEVRVMNAKEVAGIAKNAEEVAVVIVTENEDDIGPQAEADLVDLEAEIMNERDLEVVNAIAVDHPLGSARNITVHLRPLRKNCLLRREISVQFSVCN